MPVITTDILLSGIRREDALCGCDSSNHKRFLSGAFTVQDTGVWKRLADRAPSSKTLGYELLDRDSSRRSTHQDQARKRPLVTSLQPSHHETLIEHPAHHPFGLLCRIRSGCTHPELSLNQALEQSLKQIEDISAQFSRSTIV